MALEMVVVVTAVIVMVMVAATVVVIAAATVVVDGPRFPHHHHQHQHPGRRQGGIRDGLARSMTFPTLAAGEMNAFFIAASIPSFIIWGRGVGPG